MSLRCTLALLLTLYAGCAVDALALLEGKACPCARSLVCDLQTQRCVRGDVGLDLGSPERDAGPGASDAAAPDNLFPNGGFEQPAPLPGGTVITDPHAGAFGLELCATEPDGSQRTGFVYHRTDTVPTKTYRFELWAKVPPSPLVILSVQMSAYSWNGTSAQFAGRTNEIFTSPQSGWQRVSVLLDPSDPATPVASAQMRLESAVLLRDSSGAMSCAVIDDWVVSAAP